MSKIIKLKVRTSTGTCRNCGAKRKVCYLSNYSYGERLVMTSDTRYYGYVNLIKDEVFDEVESIMKDILLKSNISISAKQNADYLNSIFGIACDNIENTRIDASNNTKYCLECSSNDIDFETSGGEVIEEVAFPVISHTIWCKLDENEKRRLIANELYNKGCIKK